MGIAAYNRGTGVLMSQIDEQMVSHEMNHLRDLTEVSLEVGKDTILSPTVVRRLDGEWLVMNREDRGFGEFALPFSSLWAVARAFRVLWTSFGEDEHSFFARISPVAS